MLRPRIRQTLEFILQTGSFFYLDDFIIEEQGGTHQFAVSIRLRSNAPAKDAVFFEFTVVSDGACHARFRPAAIAGVGTKTCADEQALMQAISDWVERVREDMMATPVGRKVEEHSEILDRLMEEIHVGNEADRFTQEELSALRVRLNELEQTLAEQIRAYEKDKSKQDQKIAKIHSELENLLIYLRTVDKKTGGRALMRRLISWIGQKENQDLVASATKIAKGLLGPGEPNG